MTTRSPTFGKIIVEGDQKFFYELRGDFHLLLPPPQQLASQE